MDTNITIKKIALIAIITLSLIIPLAMITAVIDEREDTKDKAVEEIECSYAKKQTVYAPHINSNISYNQTSVVKEKSSCETLDYTTTVETDVLHRSIYDVIVYKAKIDVKGSFCVTDEMTRASSNQFSISISDLKGLMGMPVLSVGDATYQLKKDDGCLVADIKLPDTIQINDLITFALSLDLKGTEALNFEPEASVTTLNMSSAYPHPSFNGDFLPIHREVRGDGFNATWEVSDFNLSTYSNIMGVKFVELANPYQQSMRSVKYGVLIVILVFIAALLVELLTRREINLVQYAVIGLSLILFYSLLVSFSEIMAFVVAYVVAALMTVVALMLYFRAILKNNSAYILGAFIALVYILNYVLLQMQTYALLAGSLLLFVVLCVVMYLTANLGNNKKESENQE